MTVYGAIARFVGIFIGLTLLASGFFYITKLSGAEGAGMAVILVSVIMASRMFINHNRRYFSKQEGRTFFLSVWLLPLIVQGIFVAQLMKVTDLDGAGMPIFGAMLAFVLLISALATWQGMRMAKNFAIKSGVIQ